MNVSLTPELEQFVNQKVESGKYQPASEVIRDGLRLLLEREDIHQKKLAESAATSTSPSASSKPTRGRSPR
jgi:antitoxin ParD1/3/4